MRSYVASSKFHFGEAWCQMNLLNSCEVFRIAGLADFSGEIVLVPKCGCSLRAATVSGCPQGC